MRSASGVASTAAAREWREASAAGTARLIPVHEAWTMYGPVALPGSGESVSVDSDSLLASFNREVDAFVAREMGPQVRAIEDRISSRGETPTLLNRLGVLYARYGRPDEAIVQFERATAGQESAPASSRPWSRPFTWRRRCSRRRRHSSDDQGDGNKSRS